jgi:hypothetical protein
MFNLSTIRETKHGAFGLHAIFSQMDPQNIRSGRTPSMQADALYCVGESKRCSAHLNGVIMQQPSMRVLMRVRIKRLK